MKMVLVEGAGIHIENTAGEVVGFADFAELQKYTGIDLAAYVGDDQVDYEPERNFNIWFDGINTVDKAIPDTTFENLIDNVALYRSRKDDPYYGATLEEAKAQKKMDIEDIMWTYASQLFSYGGRNYYVDRENIDPTYAIASNKVIEGDTSWSIRWTTADKDGNGVSIKIDHLAASFKAFSEALYERNEGYFQVAAGHKDNMVVLTTVEDVKNYDASGGWE